MNPEPQKEHQLLQRFVGEWTFEVECMMGPDQPPSKSVGRETVRSLGGLWTIGEGEGESPGGGIAVKSMMTLGFDPQAQRFVGTFVASCMTHLWVYNGTLDASGKVLTLDTEGPSMTQAGMAKYQDIYEFVSDDHRVLSSQVQGEDGQWVRFMTAHYRRK